MSRVLKIIVALGICFSIAVTYYVMLMRHDFVIFSNPDGIPTLEE